MKTSAGIAAALAILLFGLGGIIWSPPAEKSTSPIHPYASDKPLTEPKIFGEGIISTADYELDASFTPDGKTLYFTKRTVNFNFHTIVVSHFQNGKWSTPEVAEFSGQYSDADAFVSPDGSKLFFASNRPITGTAPKRDYDIWVVERTPTGWSKPKNLGAPVNTEGEEFYPSVTVDGILYVSAIRPGSRGRFDVYRFRPVNGKYTELESLGKTIHAKFDVIDAYVARDESFLVFASNGGAEAYGRGDLYISYNRNGVWTPARNLGPKINSSARDCCPSVSPDGKYFFFTSERSFADQPLDRRLNYQELLKRLRGVLNGGGNIYQIDISALNLDQKVR